MSITFKQTIIHNLDLSTGVPLLSKELLVLTDETESFITRKIYKVIEDQGISEAEFKEQLSFYQDDQLYSIFQNWSNDKFKNLAKISAEMFYRYMGEYQIIKNGDLLVTNYLIDGKEYVALIKLNFNTGGYTHYYSVDDEVMKLVSNKNIYEEKVSEALIVNVTDNEVHVLDSTKSKYLALMFDLEVKLSVKEKLKAIDAVATKVIEEHYDNPIKALNEFKDNISESIARTQTIPIQEIMEKTFGTDEDVLESCKDHLKGLGLDEKPIEVTSSKVVNKYATQKIKTDTGIEIKAPTHIFKDPDFIEIINAPNGTQTILLKNISQAVSK